jgi:hypothetical protein
MKSGYNQLHIKEGHEWMTAFITPHGVFQLNIMTFGFMPHWSSSALWTTSYTDSPSWSTALSDTLMTPIHTTQPWKSTSQPTEPSLRDADAGITLNPKKCEFHKDHVDFLGVELSAEGFEMEHVKVKAIWEWKPLRTVRGV